MDLRFWPANCSSGAYMQVNMLCIEPARTRGTRACRSCHQCTCVESHDITYGIWQSARRQIPDCHGKDWRIASGRHVCSRKVHHTHVMADSHAAVLLNPGSNVQMPCLHEHNPCRTTVLPCKWFTGQDAPGMSHQHDTLRLARQLHIDHLVCASPVVELPDVDKLLPGRVLQVRQLHLCGDSQRRST